MKKHLLISVLLFAMAAHAIAQVEPGAVNWKPWFIDTPRSYRLPPPPQARQEISQVLRAQETLDSSGMQKIMHWNAGAPGYRWYSMASRLWMTDITGRGALLPMLMGTAIYDATLVAWDTKYVYNRPRPFAADSKVRAYVQNPESPSYPCEHSVAAGAAATLIAHFFPALTDSVNRMAQDVMTSRVAAGVAYPQDTRAGFELGKKIAEEEIALTKDYVTKKEFDGKMPQGPGVWTGKHPMLPMAGYSQTVVLDSASQFRPGPPPDFAAEMKELRDFKQTFRSQANAWHYASQPIGDDLLTRKIFEYNLHLNPPQAARVYAAVGVAYYDAFVACFDAKYAYWGIRPDQYDSTYRPIVPTPPFPGYPSGHAVMSGVVGELFSYFFPAERAVFAKVAKDGAESRFYAGIHFRTDNDAGLDLGKKVATAVIRKVSADGFRPDAKFANVRKADLNSLDKEKQ